MRIEYRVLVGIVSDLEVGLCSGDTERGHVAAQVVQGLSTPTSLAAGDVSVSACFVSRPNWV